MWALHLLGAPALIRLAHVGRRLDGRDELKDKVANTGDADDRPRNNTQHMIVQENRADEDVD